MSLSRCIVVLATLVIGSVGASGAGDAPKTAAPATQPVFIIGVWYQPTGSFPTWKQRGINTLVGYESESNRTNMDDWTGTAVDNRLFMIRQPHAHIQDDVEEPYLLAWLHHDEPDIRKPPTDPDELAAAYAEWKKADAKKPVFLNVSGGNVLFNRVPEETYRAYFKSADWVGNDFYPVSGWDNPKLIPKVGQIVDTLRDWSGGKPQLAFIESAPEHLAWTPRDTPGVTPDQMRGEIWDAVIHGVRGIVYFPQQIGGGFQYDNTPPEVVAEMIRQNRLLAEYAPILMSKPPDGAGVAVTGPIEAILRRGSDGTDYIFALNISPDSHRGEPLILTGVKAAAAILPHESYRSLNVVNSKFTDYFAPFQVHIYVMHQR